MNRAVALAVAAVVCFFSCFIAWVVFRYLPGHLLRWGFSAAIILGGAILALFLYLLVARLPPTPEVCGAVVACTLLALVLPLSSMFVYGKVTYYRFGFTAYGLIPVPLLDITVDARGILWFRKKSHLVTLAEVEAMLAPGVEVVVIGTGWNELVTVDSRLCPVKDYDLKILPTPKAFEVFNELVSQGRRAILIAHTTC